MTTSSFDERDDEGRLVGAINVFRNTMALQQAEPSSRESTVRFREMIDALPAAIYTTDAEGHLTHFNPAAVELAGRRPELGTDRWCVSWKLYYPDGTPMPHAECPMAIALKEGRAVRGVEAIIERPDGTRIWFEPYPTLVRDRTGRVVEGINMLVDITARRRTEAARAHLAAIVASSDDAIISKSLQGIIMSWNKGAEKIFGYTAAETVGQPITMLIPPLRVDEEQQILESIKRGEMIAHYETVRRRKDGTDIDISLTVSPIRSEACQIIGASKIARDITERKRTEAALQLARDEAKHTAERIGRLQTISAALVQAQSTAQIAEVVVGLGAAALRAKGGALHLLCADALEMVAMFGYPQDAIALIQRVPLAVPMPAAEVVRSGEPVWIESHQAFVERYPHLAQARVAAIEASVVLPLVWHERTEGVLTWHFVEPQQFSLEDKEFYLTLAHQCAQALERARLDEAEKMARAAADAAAARIAQLQTVTAELAVALTPAQVVEVITHQGAVALKAAAIAVKLLSADGQWLEDVDRVGDVPPAMRAADQRYPLSTATPLADAARTGAPIWLESRQAFLDHYPHLAQDMTIPGFEATCAIPLTLGVRILGGMGISFARVLDFNTGEREFLVTLARQCAQALERASLYEAEQQARVALEERVRERTAELTQRLRELDEFAYVTSHDLKAPLRAIDHLAHWISEDAADLLPASSRCHLEKLRGRITRMEKLLDDLLAYSRAGRYPYTSEPADLALLLDEIVRLVTPPQGFVVSVQTPLPVLVTQTVPLATVLRNLISNAIKHHDRRDGQVQVGVQDLGEWLEFRVSDDGPGIAPEFHERIFQLFQTLKPRDQVEGSGMGLAIVKKIIESRGGRIQVESAAQGATFRFTWPKQPWLATPA